MLEELDRAAQELNISRQAVIKTLVRQALDRWMKFAGFVESGNPGSNQSVDEIVYGQKE